MRSRLPLFAALGFLAACAPHAAPTASTGPTVSYRMAGDDVTQANAAAARYCQRYGATALLQGVRSTSSGNVATFSCSGAQTTTGSLAPAPPAPAYATSPPAQGYGTQGYGATSPPIRCADPLHQDRPGGTDYKGPPVPQCPPSY